MDDANKEKKDFLNYILNNYGGFLENEKKKQWIKDCWEVLENEVNFAELRIHFLHNFDTKNLNNIPSPQWLYKESRQFLKEKKSAVELTKEALEKNRVAPQRGENATKYWEATKKKLEEMGCFKNKKTKNFSELFKFD